MSKVKKSYADMDPIEEIRAIREELSREFPTPKDLCEYLWKNYPGSRPKPEPRMQSQRAAAKSKPRANARPAMRQRKAAVHA